MDHKLLKKFQMKSKKWKIMMKIKLRAAYRRSEKPLPAFKTKQAQANENLYPIKEIFF